MTDSKTHVDATFYVQLAPEWSSYFRQHKNLDHPDALLGARIVRHTLTKPERPQSGTVLVKLTVRLPRAAFYPLRPEAVVEIPESMTITTPIEVVAESPEGGQ